MNPRTERFIDGYVKTGNATRAYIDAGFAEHGAGQAAHKLLKRAEVQFQLMAFGTFVVGAISDTFGAEIAFAGLGVGLVALSAALWAYMPRIRYMD
jgi:hypothetical protein